jgi:hypothetical protein
MSRKERGDQEGFQPAAAGKRTKKPKKEKEPQLMWLNHFDLLPGDPSVSTSHEAVSSGVGGGLTGLVITSSMTGQTAATGGNKVVHMAVDVPPEYVVTGVRIGYELSDARSHISQVRLAQVQDPPEVALVLLDDPTDHTAVGPIHVDSSTTSIDPEEGALLLSLRLNFGDVSDKIVIRSLALHLMNG